MKKRSPSSIQAIRAKHIDAYEKNLDLIESDTGVERQDRADYDGRFIFELLQNAVDEMAETSDPKVRIELSEESLLVANNGEPFTHEDLYALTLPTRTTKAGGTTIGYKGRGFTSVLGITDCPAVYAADVNASFDRERTAAILNEWLDIDAELGSSLDASQVPTLRIPVEATPSDRIQALLKDGYTTVFEFPLRDPEDLFGRIERKLETLEANTVALLPKLEHIEIECPEWERTWQVERSEIEDATDATLIYVRVETIDETGRTAGKFSYILFERTAIDQNAVAEDTNLSATDIKTIGELAVGIAFRAMATCESPTPRTADWKLQPVYGESRSQPPYIHVFLPTKERSPVPALVTGTFQSDTSRRNLTLDYDEELGYAGQFNARLFEEVGTLVAEEVVPFVRASATTAAEFLSAVDPALDGRREWSFTPGSTEHCLFESLKTSLASASFLPGNRGDDVYTIDELVVPHTGSEKTDLGRKFVVLVGASRIEVDDHAGYLPAASLLEHRTAMTLRALGAAELHPEQMPSCIEQSAYDPPLERHGATGAVRAQGFTDDAEDAPCVLYVDPVLVFLVETRKTLESDEAREAFDTACRRAAVFPVDTVTRRYESLHAIRTQADNRSFFIPPEEAIDGHTFPNLAFLPRMLYHGTNPEQAKGIREEHLPVDFRSELENIWDLTSFGFARVFDTAIRPAIPGPNTPNADTSPLESRKTLEAIRTMANVESPENDRDPQSPLLYRTSRRPFFDLSKLPVPAVSLDGGNDPSVEWKPAHQVYVSDAWQAAVGCPERARIEPLLSAVGEHAPTARFDPWFLAPPDWFGLSETDTTDLERWVAFFRWLGVAAHVRPLPLFAPDPATRHRYRDTKGLSRPPRSTIAATDSLAETDGSKRPVDSRYDGLSEDDWEAYRSHLLEHVEPHIETEDHRYISQINSLEYAEELLAAAKANESIGTRLLTHLVVWWDDGLVQHRHATVAEFTNNRWRGSNISYFFTTDERVQVGSNLWLWQLQDDEWLPTSLGTVAPQDAWLLPESDHTRFSLELDRERSLLPFVERDQSASSSAGERSILEVAAALDIGVQLEQAAFSSADARRVLSEIAKLLDDASVNLARFAGEIEPIYTRVAGLMPGLADDDTIAESKWDPDVTGLRSIKVLCRLGDEYAFRPAGEAYFVRSHSARERYASLGLPLITLFKRAAPGFGTHLGATDIHDVVTETPASGEELGLSITIDGFQIDENWIEMLLAGLLLRIRTDRVSEQDEQRTQRFYEQLEFVDGLEVEMQTTGEGGIEEPQSRERPYFIHRENQKRVDVRVDASLPQDEFIDAFARAYTDYLNISGYYEGVESLIDQAFNASDPAGRIVDRLRVVGSGATVDQLTATRKRLFSEGSTEPEDEFDHLDVDQESELTEPDVEREGTSEKRVVRNGTGTAARSDRIPDLTSLQRIGSRRIFEPDSVNGGRSQAGNGTGASGGSGNGRSSTPASQEYRSLIDAFGMRVTFEAEWARLAANGEDHTKMMVWDVSTPETYAAARRSPFVRTAIQRFVTSAGLSPIEDPFDTDWPGFDVLTLATNSRGEPIVDRCIELKTSGLNTRKPSLSWNEWKAAKGELADRYYLYVVRNIRKGKSGDATLLEIPRPFQTLVDHQRERRAREVQLDLRSFNLDEESIVQQTIEWEE
ncbi:protein of unknown function [Halogranum rubrum]|uniref:Protein NO VEIN C-terminal domain-containing protein n=1 Tax=Halogranum rubrum TaxID=553466 RepID=A0A1I4GPC7_9EURY|nr:DUF3883 domain-containing protein [Halogranum rubrum]SFL31769.1 protein of unknown function [Halogranum rubrum]